MASRSPPPESSPAVKQVLVAARKLKSNNPVNWSLRNAGIVTRVAEPPGLRIRQAAFQVRASVTQTLGRLGLNMDGLEFPGFLETRTIGGQSVQISVAKAIFPSNRALIDEVAAGKHDFVTEDADNAALFSDAIRSLETTTAVLRVVEARIDEVRSAIALCEQARSTIGDDLGVARQRLVEVELRLAEARHDVTTTLALLAEESARVNAVNAERERILAEEVPFVAWCRPRVVDATDALPVHDIEPALRVDPVRVGLSTSAPAAPEELHELVELVRHLPARAVKVARARITDAGTLGRLGALLEESGRRGKAAAEDGDRSPAPAPGKGRQRTRGLVHARKKALLEGRRQAPERLEIRPGASWQELRALADRTISLDDLLSSPVTSSETSRVIASFIADLHKAAAWLFSEIAGVDARIRLTWAEQLSEDDGPADLRDPAILPDWQHVDEPAPGAERDPFRRQELEAWIEWIFAQFDEKDAEALAYAQDLVRVAILLASHAPVDALVHAHVEEATVLQIGGILPILLDTATLAVGTPTVVVVDDVVLAHGVVEDVTEGRARTRLTSVPQGRSLAAGQSVRLVEAKGGHLGDAPLTRRK